MIRNRTMLAVAVAAGRDLVPALCASWHEQTVEPADRTPVVSDKPT